MKKKIDHILFAREKQITETEVVRQPLPHKDFRFANPFIVLHHGAPRQIPANTEAFRIHPHPHRGFAPVTFMLQGQGYHKDNAGHDQVVNAGDVQWMFAGKGLLHSEGPTKEFLQRGGVYEFIQLWINVPRAHKWDAPYYKAAAADQLPAAVQEDGVQFRLASGSYNGQEGPLGSFTPVITMIGEVAAGKQVTLHATPGYWALLYVAAGQVTINDSAVTGRYNLFVFEKEHEEITVIAREDARLLFLSAQPIDEPVAARDNFVMNAPEEVEQAISDYHKGVFGQLEF